jgi:uncharacterized protein (DUF433 family)
MSAPPITTYHYVTQVPGTCGGRPIIRGTRTSVKSLVGYYKLGLSVEEMLEELPHLTPAQIHEALSYYHDHSSEIEQDIETSRLEGLIERYGLKVTAEGRIVPVENRED